MAVFYEEYESLGRIGKGAFASIFKVKHLVYGYVRALKVLDGTIENEQDKAYQSFLKECKFLLKIGNGCHPNIVRVYQPRLIQNHALVEMDYVKGDTLQDYLEKTKYMSIGEIYKFIRQIGGALAYCHEDIYLDQMSVQVDKLQLDPNDASKFLIDETKRQALIKKYRIIHNDLHDTNVMRRHYDGDFILLDFGLAIQDDVAVKSSSLRHGAPEYRSPEKCNGSKVETPQNDIYSFGVLLYEVLTGLPPFPLDRKEYESKPEKAIVKLEEKHLHEAPPAIEAKRKAAFEAAHPGEQWNRDYPEWLDRMVMKCLAKKPEDRYKNAKELIADFNHHLAKDRQAQNTAISSKQVEALQNKVNILEAKNKELEEECNRLKGQTPPPVQPLVSPNAEIVEANKIATEAQQKCDILQAKVEELEKEFAKRHDGSIPPDREPSSFMKILIWALLGIALGIFLGIAGYYLFFDKPVAPTVTTELVDQALEEAAPVEEAAPAE